MSNYKNAQIGDKVFYIGYWWRCVDILPSGSRVMYRPFWKLKKIGIVIT